MRDRYGHPLTIKRAVDGAVRYALVSALASVTNGQLICTGDTVVARVAPDEKSTCSRRGTAQTVLVSAASSIIDLIPDRWSNPVTIAIQMVKDAYKCVQLSGVPNNASNASGLFEQVMSCVGAVLGYDNYRSSSTKDP